MKKILALALASALSLSLLTGCGGSKTPAPTGTGAGTTPSTTAPSAAKDSLVVATSGQPVRFFSCGPDGSNNNDLVVLNNCYDPLVALKADGSVAPALAESWVISEDGMVYTFKLRQGVKFHNGDVLTPDDVVFTFDLASQNSTGKALIINYDHAEAVDANTVAIHLSAPFAPFINSVASRAAYIIDKSYYEEVGVEGYLSAPVGTGPYKFISSVTGDKVVLEGFDEYWNGAPAIKNVTIQIMTDATTQSIALENGDVDAILSPAIGSCLNFAEGSGVKWDNSASAGRVTLHLSENKGYPGADKNFRKAVQCAINKEDIIAGAMEGYATALDIDICPSYTALPTGYDVVANDVEQAKKYLADSTYQGEDFEIIVQSGTAFETAAQIIQAQLLEVGIQCTVTAMDTATFTERWYGGTYGGMIRNTTSSLLDADGISNFFMATAYAPTDHNQYGRTKEIYDICMEARATQGDARKDLYLKAVNIVTEEAYQVPLFANTNTLAYREGLTGLTVHPLTLVSFADWSWT